MFKYFLYAVKDVVAGNFGAIQVFINDDYAKRWFKNLTEKSDISGDLQLFKLGVFEVETGVISDVQCTFLVGGTRHE